MKIAIVASMPYRGYSGGRYHAFILAQCLAAEGNDVFFITDTIPQFARDFVKWQGYSKICYVITREFVLKQSLGNDFDFVIIVPVLSADSVFCNNCKMILDKLNGRLVVLNFETPNWFNRYIPVGRETESLYGIKGLLNFYDGIVLSSTEISKEFAVAYYGTGNKENISYQVWNPAINSIAADQSGAVKKEKRIIAMVRLKDRHKGGDDLIKILSQPLNGYSVVLISGSGSIHKKYQKELKQLGSKYGFQFEVKKKLSDYEKFREIKRAEILLFPTRFEGYGYPPVEARYCGTVCITYDLPVLREVNGNQVIYCDYDNVESMKENLAKAIQSKVEIKKETDTIREKGDCMIRSKRVNDLLSKHKKSKIYPGGGAGAI